MNFLDQLKAQKLQKLTQTQEQFRQANRKPVYNAPELQTQSKESERLFLARGN